MTQEILFRMPSPFRDEFRIRGFRFGSGKRALAVVGTMRGDEIQQQYTCARLVAALEALERNGAWVPGYEVLVIPSANPFSMNIGKRFWPMDSTDINRMFPGYERGETTQRIAAALFECVKDYDFGVQLASFYIPGEFIPHIRMLETGYQPEREAAFFGLPYVYVKKPNPYDTTLLNYNWQIWNTKAFSLYAGHTDALNEACTRESVEAVLRFLDHLGVICHSVVPGYRSTTITDADLVTVKSGVSGILRPCKHVQEQVVQGEVLAQILDPYDTSVRQEVTAPTDGVLFFRQENPLVLEGAPLFRLIEDRTL